MERLIVLFCLVTLAFATPPVVRTRADLESFRSFLESKTHANIGSNADSWIESGKYEGDILLDDFMVEGIMSSYASGRNAYIFPNTRWPNDTVVWDFAEGYFDDAQKEAILKGIKEIEDRTCVRFRRRENGETIFVNVEGNPRGCFANVGYWGPRGVHTYNLAPNTPGVGCFRHTTIIHEFLHIIGFYHMQSTYNRDKYIKVMWENIQAGTEHNFHIRTRDIVSNLALPYEYISNMHYWDTGFSINGQPTLVALQEFEGVMGQQEFVTDLDYLRVNRHYFCPGAWD